MKSHTIAPCLWFDNEAEQAATFYTSIFPNSKIVAISRYGKEGYEFHGKDPGTVMIVHFQLNGYDYTALNGGPQFKFDEAVSLQIFCETQEEIDHYWNKLTAGGEEGPCGWLKDQFGLSWQVVPTLIVEQMNNPERAGAIMNAVLQMKKPILEELENA